MDTKCDLSNGPQNRAKRRMESVLRHLSNNRIISGHKNNVPIDSKSCVFKSTCHGAANVADDIEDIATPFLSRKHSADTGDDSGDLNTFGLRRAWLIVLLHVHG